MKPLSGPVPLRYQRIERPDLSRVLRLDLDPDHVERFLGPIPDILHAVRRGPAHSLTGIECEGRLVGFFVLHPDRRDGLTWWLGWFAMDRRVQGRGYGRQALAEALRRLRALPACGRVRLLVSPENAAALGLYLRSGFRIVGSLQATGELLLECAMAAVAWLQGALTPLLARVLSAVKLPSGHRRMRSSVGPHAAWVIGVERGPPAAA